MSKDPSRAFHPSSGTVRNLTRLRAVPALALIGLFSGCIFTERDPKPLAANPDANIQVHACADVPAAAKRAADSLVELGTAQMVGDLRFVFGDSARDWADVKGRSPAQAAAYFGQALELAPGHCGALFGKAITTSLLATQDPRLDSLARQLDGSSGDGLAKVGSGRGLLKLRADQAAPLLVRASGALDAMDKPAITRAQEVTAQVLLPRLDSTIAMLEQVMKAEGFAFEYRAGGRLYRLDRGEVGPALAGLKVAKAWGTVVAGYDWEVAMGGSYSFWDTLGNIRNADFDHLSPGQTAALDHLTGLFLAGSPFSRVKPEWKAQVRGIPSLLLSAVGDAQRGLEISIAKGGADPASQAGDVLVVGPGPDADVDTSDLRSAWELLERSKKYLTGEVAVPYDKGSRTLRVDFPKLFEMDGAQNFLPYFKFYPYAQWNDTVQADTTWSPSLAYGTQREIFAGLGLDPQDYELSLRSLNPSWLYQVADSFSVTLNASGRYRPFLLATLTPKAGSPCAFDYDQIQAAVSDSTGYGSPRVVPKPGNGTLTVAACRERAGEVEYRVSPDSSWPGNQPAETWASEPYGAALAEIAAKLGSTGQYVSTRTTPDGKLQVYVEAMLPVGVDTIMAVLHRVPDQACAFDYAQSYGREPDPDAYSPDPGQRYFRTVPKPAQGRLRLRGCKENGGQPLYVEDIDAALRGPIAFTDASGKVTLTLQDLAEGNYGDNLAMLWGKITFPDPTFGGIFPGLTNETIWNYVESFRAVEPRSREVCSDHLDANGVYRWECTMVKAKDPSDLDLLVENLYWVGKLLDPETRKTLE